MAAYAAVVSVMNILDQIQNHPRHSFSFDRKQMESLRENVDFLVDFLEYCSDAGSKDGEALESQIATAAFAAEDVLESHVVDQIHAGSTLNGETSSCFLVDLQEVIEDMESTKKSAMEVIAERGLRDQLTKFPRPATSSRPLTAGKYVMADYDDELIQLMDVLTRQTYNRQIIPIVGMGGIGKTTLARNVYESACVAIDASLSGTTSQEYKEMNEKLLEEIKTLKAEKNELREEKLVLKADKERIEQQLKTMAVPPTGFMPPHPPMYQTGPNKMPMFPGYSIVPMWQYMPPSARDTSQDHELRPPAA